MNGTLLVLHYNDPDSTEKLLASIVENFPPDRQLVVVDNGSDPDKKPPLLPEGTYLVTLESNGRMIGGFNAGLSAIRNNLPPVDYVWMFTSDCWFQSTTPPARIFERYYATYPEIGIFHPSEAKEVVCCFDVHNARPSGCKIVWMYDFVCPLFTSKALDAIGWQLNPAFTNGWGIDYETSYIIRSKGMKVVICHDLIVGHNTSSTYDKGLDPLFPNRDVFYSAAYSQMYSVLSTSWGSGWRELFEHNNANGVGTWISLPS